MVPHPAPPCDNSFDPNVDLVCERSVSPGIPPETPRTEAAYGYDGLQEQISSQLGNDYPPKHAFLETGDNPGIHYQVGEDRGYMSHPRAGSTPSSSPPLMTRRHSHQPSIGVYDQEGAWSGRQETHDTAFGISQSTGAPHEGVSRTTVRSEGMEHTVGDSPPFLPSPIDTRGQYTHTTGRSRRSRGRPTLVDPKSNRGVYRTWSRSMDARRISINHGRRPTSLAQVDNTQALPRNCASRSSGRPHQDQIAHGRDSMALHVPYPDDNRLNPQILTDHTFPMRGRSGGRSDIIKLAETLDTHNSGASRGGQYQGGLAESSRMAQHSRSEREARGVADLAPKKTLRMRPPGRNYGGHQQGFATQLPMVSPPLLGSVQRIKIVQTRYSSANRQGDWIQQPSIEFGWFKLSDAANPNYTGIPALHDQAFNHEGVGGAILCRLNFCGNEIGRSKIMTTNQRSTPEPTTKKKLASEVAKLVERCIGGIKAQPGYSNVTFENVMLTRLHHVSKSSWQPELWYEVAAPGHN